ncbi:hypothetical protein D9611_009323 [Ephemerocybe angulata]|uniref:Copper-fist domain-containing protein n=1 Tax=Ephemerocybe angulata TaxID=980116 RepID=A0A8H5F4A2_9AGAR|nr:hypothetical protein D9611_009323 [Tulosesus angulatus]
MIISSKKYACETCIKGHRSSSCKHFDRPLFEIKKKGRPVTQCEHCRELRKTKQVHVKCICEGRLEHTPVPKGVLQAPPAPAPASGWLTVKSICRPPTHLGTKPGFESAAFPNGLPLHALETSVALPDAFSSDSDMSGGNSIACHCKDGGSCHCCVPRKSAVAGTPHASSSKARKLTVKFETHDHEKTDLSVFGDASRIQSNTAQILARIAELRPVLPRPAESPTSMHQHPRHHDNTFSPYERAYGISHHQPLHGHPHSSSPTNATHYNMNAGQSPVENTGFFPSVCQCGDTCQCPGCTYHNHTILSAESAFSTCTNPGHCATCLDCTILSLQNTPMDTALSIPQSSQDASNNSESVDEWLRQLTSQASVSDAPFNDFSASGPSGSSSASAPSMWNNPDYGSSDLVPGLDFDFNNPGMYEQMGYPRGQGGGAVPDYTRSRSVSTSSQSSTHLGQDGLPQHDRSMSGVMQVPYRPSGRLQGQGHLFENAMGSRSAPQLNLSMYRGGGPPGSNRVSPVPYASSNPDAPMSPHAHAPPQHDRYDPSMDGLHIR